MERSCSPFLTALWRRLTTSPGLAPPGTVRTSGTHALTEFTGLDPDGISFDIFVSAYLGVDPMTEVVKIWNYERSGTAVPLTIGTHAYGKYRWSIKSHKMKAQTYDKRGDITSATISLTLQEYI